MFVRLGSHCSVAHLFFVQSRSAIKFDGKAHFIFYIYTSHLNRSKFTLQCNGLPDPILFISSTRRRYLKMESSRRSKWTWVSSILLSPIRRKKKSNNMLLYTLLRNIYRRKLQCAFTLILMISNKRRDILRSCRHLTRNNTGWWIHVWNTYSDNIFKQNSRLSKATFIYILELVEPIDDVNGGALFSKETLAEEPISLDQRLPMFLSRMGRWIVRSRRCYSLPNSFGKSQILLSKIYGMRQFLFQNLTKIFESLMEGFEMFWQFPYYFGAIDGCHITNQMSTQRIGISKEVLLHRINGDCWFRLLVYLRILWNSR